MTYKPGVYVGVDAHKEKCVACFLDTTSGESWTVEFLTRKKDIETFAQQWLRKDMVVGLEATSNAWFIAVTLAKYVRKVIMVEPRRFHDGVKTDQKDAERLAISLAQGTYKACWIPNVQTHVLRRIAGYWTDLRKEINRTKNRLHATLTTYGITLSNKTPFSKKGREELEEIIKTLPKFIAYEIISTLKRLDLAEEIKEELENLLAEIAKEEPLVHLLVTIPGISFVSALFVLSEIGDIKRFNTPGKLVRYAGLCPSLHQSGGKSYSGGITKAGRKRLRWILTQAANNAIRVEGRIRNFYLRLRDRKHHNVAIVATARKMLVIIWHMLQKGEIFRDCIERLYKKKARLMEKKAANAPAISLPDLIAQLMDFLHKEEADTPTGKAELWEEVVKMS